MAHARIVYADYDRERLITVTGVLTSAGYEVWPCLGDAPVLSITSFNKPDLILLCSRLDECLNTVAAALWPTVPTLVLHDTDDYRQLPLRIALTLRRSELG